MTKAIVTTTINAPTEALLKYSQMEDWTLVVAGDLKTPHEAYAGLRGRYLNPEWQMNYDLQLSDAIGWNCIQRRNFAFLYAAKELGADLIATIDDDNIPLPGWEDSAKLFDGAAMMRYQTDQCAFDPLSVTAYDYLWHRGFPLQLLRRRRETRMTPQFVVPDIVASFWNGDPDIDAICRMQYAPDVEFNDAGFPFAANKPSPFNSQNTMLSAKVMPHYFMFPGIGRMDDIWASYHVQARGYTVAYNKATVIQKRNAHDLIADMKGEYLGYENNLAICEDIPHTMDAVIKRLPHRALKAFELYQKHYE